jgi:hypothetical protein
MLPEKGVYEITLKIYAPIIRSAGKSRVTLSLPRAAVSRLNITVPGEGLEFELTSRRCLHRAACGRSNAVRVLLRRWFAANHRLGRGAGGHADGVRSFSRSTKLSTQVGTGSVATTADITLRILRAPISELKIALPADQEILGVTGAGIKEWKIEAAAAGRKTLDHFDREAVAR